MKLKGEQTNDNINNDINIYTNKTVYAKKDEVISQVKEQNLFSNVNFVLIDNLSLQEKYKQIGKKLEKTFSFQQTVMLPVIKGVEQSYVGILKAKSLITLMTDDNKNFIPTVFYDNVVENLTNKCFKLP